MFYYFLEEYKEMIRKNSKHQFTRYEIYIFVFIILCALISLFSLILNWHIILIIIPFSAIVLSIYILHSKNKRDPDALITKHKKNNINTLINLLNKHELNTASGIDWLIDCCNNKKNQKNVYHYSLVFLKDFFIVIIYPTIIFCLGPILQKSTISEIIIFCALLILMFFTVAAIIIELIPSISSLEHPYKELLDSLECDLKYIKVQNLQLNGRLL